MKFKTPLWLVALMWCFSFDAFSEQSFSLQQAIRFALQNNPRAVVLLKQRQIAEAEIRTQSQRNNPSVILEDTRSQPNYFAGGGYLVELGGKRGKRIDVARSEAAVAAMEYNTGILSLRHDVRLDFYELLQLQQKRTEMQVSRDLAKRLKDIAQQRFEAGEIARFEVLEAELEAKRRENEWKQTEAEMQTALIELNTVLNRNPQDPIHLEGALEDHPSIATPESLLANAAAQHFELQSLQQQIKAEEGRLSLARAERIPDLDMEAGTEIHDAEFEYGWRAALRMDVPILNRHDGEISKSQLALESLKMQQNATLSRIRSEISSAYLRYQSALYQQENYRKQVLPVATEIEELSEESYREGKTGILSVLDAQRNIRQVKMEYLDVLLQVQKALADLELAANVELP